MIRLVADDKIPYLKGVLEPYVHITYMPGSQITRSSIMETDGLLVRTRTRCNSDLLAGTNVRFVATATIGFDHIDTGWCDKHSIKWTNAPGCNSSSVRQYVAAALLRISEETGISLRNKTIGIVGVGNVGSKVQKLAEAFGMRVLLNDPPRARKEGGEGFVSLEKILAEADFITLHVPLNIEGIDKTLHLFNREYFGRMKRGVWFLNTSRGEVVETEALKDAIANEKLAGAVIDVWEKEPEIDIALMHMAFIATPHIAGYSADGKANGTAMVVNSISAEFRLPLTDWYPSEIPAVEEQEIIIECKGRRPEDAARKAVFHSYNILEDDIRLRFDPSKFEKERETYPLRREFHHYTIILKDCDKPTEVLIRNLGFNIVV